MHVFCGLGIILAKVVTSYTSQPPAKQKMGRKRTEFLRDGQYPFIKTPQC